MIKKEKIRYDKMIDGIADKIVFSAYQQALGITEDVYLDILFRMKAKIESNISTIQERKGKQ